MLERNAMIKSFRHYCDMIWEYNRKQDAVFVHYDEIASGFENTWYSINTIAGIFRDRFMFEIDDEIWDKYLNKEYLLSRFSEEKDTTQFYLRFRLKNTELKWYEIHTNRIDENSILIIGRDLYDEICQRSASGSVVGLFDGVVNIDVNTGKYIVSYADRMKSLPKGGYDYEHALNNFVDNYVIDKNKESIRNSMSLDKIIEKLETNDEYIVYVTVKNPDGSISYKRERFAYFSDKRQIITLSRLDISAIVEKYEKKMVGFKEEIYRDALTGARNRNYFEKKVKNKRISGGVAVIDIDDFKLCNDTKGHGVGDEILVTLTHIITDIISVNDTVIRYGGDEFLLLVRETNEGHFDALLRLIRESIYNANVVALEGIKVSVSIGGVIAKDEVAEDAIWRADRLMYRAKKMKNAVVTESTSDGENRSENEISAKKQRVLIVDDSAINRGMLSDALKDDYIVSEAENGEECMKILNDPNSKISLLLLDIVMPVMDGFSVLAEMTMRRLINEIPVIMISSDETDKNIKKAYSMGVCDYISRPFDAKIVNRRVTNTISLYAKQRRIVAILKDQFRRNGKYSKLIINAYNRAFGLYSGEVEPSVSNVSVVTAILLEKLMINGKTSELIWEDRRLIAAAAALHDIGKIGVERSILCKPSALNDDEYEKVKHHPQIGEEIIRSIEGYEHEPFLKTAAEICRKHHERIDGRGYPDGLKGDEIPLYVQVVSLADVYDALVSKRVYKQEFPSPKAIEMIAAGECGAFDPTLIECLCECSDRLEELYTGADFSAVWE